MDRRQSIHQISTENERNVFIKKTIMKYKNIIIFIMITFLRSVFISMIKFFLRSYLKDVHISLEEIA